MGSRDVVMRSSLFLCGKTRRPPQNRRQGVQHIRMQMRGGIYQECLYLHNAVTSGKEVVLCQRRIQAPLKSKGNNRWKWSFLEVGQTILEGAFDKGTEIVLADLYAGWL